MYMFLLWYVEYLMCSACPLQFSFIEHALTSVSAVLMVLAFWDTVQISSVTPSFTLEEPLGLLIMRMKSNFYTKLSKHLTGLCPQEQYWYCPQQKSLQWLQRAERHCQDLSMFQVFHVLRGFLNIFKKNMFQINNQTN